MPINPMVSSAWSWWSEIASVSRLISPDNSSAFSRIAELMLHGVDAPEILFRGTVGSRDEFELGLQWASEAIFLKVSADGSIIFNKAPTVLIEVKKDRPIGYDIIGLLPRVKPLPDA